jgi:hypothetical protein
MLDCQQLQPSTPSRLSPCSALARDPLACRRTQQVRASSSSTRRAPAWLATPPPSAVTVAYLALPVSAFVTSPGPRPRAKPIQQARPDGWRLQLRPRRDRVAVATEKRRQERPTSIGATLAGAVGSPYGHRLEAAVAVRPDRHAHTVAIWQLHGPGRSGLGHSASRTSDLPPCLGLRGGVSWT